MNISQYISELYGSLNFEQATTRELEEVVDTIIEEVRRQGILGFGLVTLFDIFWFPTHSHSSEKIKCLAGATTYLIFFLRDKSNAWRAGYDGIQELEAEVSSKALGVLLRCMEMGTIPDYVIDHKSEIKDKLVPMLNKIRNNEVKNLSNYHRKFVSANEAEITKLMDFLSA